MPPARRRTHPIGRSTARRRVEWADATFTHNAVASGVTVNQELLTTFVAASGSREGLTIMRIHGFGSYAPASVGGVSRLGIIVDDINDAPPSPLTFPYQDWMINRAVFPTASGAAVDAVRLFEIDLRSKRKLHGMSDGLYMVWEPTDTGTSSINVQLRILVALP
jgi:hypothetical protein